MSQVRLINKTKPATPSSGQSIIFVDSSAKILCLLDDAGRVAARSSNASVAGQASGFSSDTYVTKSDLLIPSFGLQAGGKIRWKVSLFKSAAGTATPIWSVRIGSNRSTADTARVTLTTATNTAVADFGMVDIIANVHSVHASTGVISGSAAMKHNGAAVGLANNDAGWDDALSTPFDNSNLGGLYIGLSLNAGASAVWELTQVQADADW